MRVELLVRGDDAAAQVCQVRLRRAPPATGPPAAAGRCCIAAAATLPRNHVQLDAAPVMGNHGSSQTHVPGKGV